MFRILGSLGLFLLAVAWGTSSRAESPPEPRSFEVRAFGAQGDGSTLDTQAIQKALDSASDSGGGTVRVSPGIYLCGSLHLRSHVTLYLEAGATIQGTTDESQYDPCEVLGFKNDADRETSFFHHSLLWGEDLERVSILGQGTIDSHYRKRRGPKAIALKRCKFVDIKGIQILNCPNYCISLLGTDYVNIDGVTILNGYADGIDPDACRNVRISNCHIESHDDAIVPKASFSLGERRSTENVTVTNCYLGTRCNGFKLGTESGGDFKRIAVSNCVIAGLAGKGPATGGVCIESVDGSRIEDVVVSNIAMVDVRSPLFIRLGNRGRDLPEPVPGSIERVLIQGISATCASVPSTITGIPGHPVREVTVSQVRLRYSGGIPFLPKGETVPEMIDRYPDPDMFSAMAGYGLYCRHVEDLTLAEIDLTYEDAFWRVPTNQDDGITWITGDGIPTPSEPGNPGYALHCEDITDLDLSGFEGRPSDQGDPVVVLRDVREALVRGCKALPGTAAFLKVEGDTKGNIGILANDFRNAKEPIRLDGEALESTIKEQGNLQ